MITFINIPKNMDKQMYIKHLSKQYKMPFDILWSLIKDCNTEKEFYNVLNWNLSKNGYNWKIKDND